MHGWLRLDPGLYEVTWVHPYQNKPFCTVQRVNPRSKFSYFGHQYQVSQEDLDEALIQGFIQLP
jgi:hypothetical protein